MSTELSNGVIIPEEYSDDWYDEMSINLRKLNDVITAASDNATDIQRLDTDKANQSDLTALTSRVSQNETDIIALQTAVSGALKREIVQTLPTEDISTTTIYMIRNSQSSGTNIYDEYMYINSQWELIGTSATDFSNYYTKNETDNLLSGKVDNSTLGSYYTKTESDNLLLAKANQTDLTALSGRVTQTETDITALQTAVSGALKREIVQTLPTQDISTTTIYMIRNTTTSGDNIYDEYMYINNLWELIGTSATDFSNYYTKTEIDTLLSGKADDNSVVHTSGSETIGGQKTFTNSIILQNSDTSGLSRDHFCKSQIAVLGDAVSGDNTKYRFVDKNNNEICYIRQRKLTNSNTDMSFCVNNIDNDNNSISAEINFVIDKNNDPRISPSVTDSISLGRPTFRWKSIYSNSYYYGNVEFSTKFVTSDTVQTITGNKLFEGEINSASSIVVSQDSSYVTGIKDTKLIDKNLFNILNERITYNNSRNIRYTWTISNKDSSGNTISSGVQLALSPAGQAYFYPIYDNDVFFGASTAYIKGVFTKLINGLTPSSLSLPSGTIADQVDISSYFTNTGSGDTNSYTALANGWVYLYVTACSTLTAYVQTSNNTLYSDYKERSSDGQIRIMLPIQKNNRFTSLWTTSTTVSITKAVFIPCLGNI